jgi:hypothetical protein
MKKLKKNKLLIKSLSFSVHANEVIPVATLTIAKFESRLIEIVSGYNISMIELVYQVLKEFHAHIIEV